MKKNRMKNMVRRETVNEKLKYAATLEWNKFYEEFQTSSEGMTKEQLEASEENYGKNIVTHGQKESLFKRICGAFINPFTAILFVLAAVSVFTDIIFADPGEQNPVTVIIITTMVMISGLLRFIQETRSGNAAARLSAMIRTTTCVKRREEGSREILLEYVAVGDVVLLSAGDMIPADIRIISAKDLFISQSALTGESEPVEKCSALTGSTDAETNSIHGVMSSTDAVTDYSNLAFMGSNVISGSASGVVIAVGNDTMLGEMAKSLSDKPAQTSFEKGVNSVSWVLIRFMLIMVPVVFFINGYTKNDWMDAALFAISVAVGLTPEMLPMIVTTCLAKGAVSMSRQKVIIKNLNAIQNLGAMNILCTDKTGTLTQDRIVLEYPLDVHGNVDERVLRHAFLNSYHQTGLRNLMDDAIVDHAYETHMLPLWQDYRKVDEIPFDFTRRRMSVVVADKAGKTQIITKGAVEEMLSICSYAEYKGNVEPLTSALSEEILATVRRYNEAGLRVIAVAHKTNPMVAGAFSVADESDMVLIG